MRDSGSEVLSEIFGEGFSSARIADYRGTLPSNNALGISTETPEWLDSDASGEVNFVRESLQSTGALADEEFYLDNRNLAFWYLGAAILISMADAYVDAHLAGFDVSPDLGFTNHNFNF